MGRGVRKPCPATLAGTEQLLQKPQRMPGWEEVGEHSQSRESLPSCSVDGKREDKRETGTKGQEILQVGRR